MPGHPAALALIEAAGCPVAGPSANRSGRPSPTDAAAAAFDLGESVNLVLDAGSVEVGLESTVIDLTAREVFLLRPGGTPREILENFFGAPLRVPGAEDGSVSRRSPGTRYRHYAPVVPVHIWDARGANSEPFWDIDPSESGFMGLTPSPFEFRRTILFDSAENYARGLFAGFRSLEQPENEGGGCRSIVVEWPGAEGIGLALRDRIRRASGN
jgi:L-threonylcarbamoyladenylate synthase